MSQAPNIEIAEAPKEAQMKFTFFFVLLTTLPKHFKHAGNVYRDAILHTWFL